MDSVFGQAPPLPPQSLWSFNPDGTGGGTWKEVINSTASVWSSIAHPVVGLQVYGSNKAWYLGRQSINIETDIQMEYITPESVVSGLTTFDMTSKSFTNISAWMNGKTKSFQFGALQHVSVFGPEGLVVILGGSAFEDDSQVTVDIWQIPVYDPASQQ